MLLCYLQPPELLHEGGVPVHSSEELALRSGMHSFCVLPLKSRTYIKLSTLFSKDSL